MNTHETLVAARNLLERRGWARGWRGMCPDGPMCMEGALGLALGVPVVRAYLGPTLSYMDVRDSDAYEVLRAATGTDFPVWVWQDARMRTEAEVFAAFDRAIAATAPPPPVPDLEPIVDEVVA